MNPITITLPEPPDFEISTSQENGKPIPSKGVIWFPEEADRIIWMQALGTHPADYLVLQTLGYQLHVQVFIGEGCLHRLPGDCLCLIYLPGKGLSDERYPEGFFQLQNSPQYSMRLFQPIELGHHFNEESVLDEFSAEALHTFHTAPFLGLAEAKFYPLFHRWLAAVVVFVNLSAEKAILDYQLDIARSHSIPLLALRRGHIQCREDLADLLKLSWQGRQLLDEIKRVQARLGPISMVVHSLPKTIHKLAEEGTDATSKRVYNVPFVSTLGAELLPQQHKLLKKIREFAGQLSSSKQEQLENIGKVLQHILSSPRILVLIGAYSSGKTTLLNMLLLGEGGTRAFHTNRAANTAIISEISHVAPDGKEFVTFHFRDRVEDFALATPDQTRSDITSQENIMELLDLLKRRILHSPQIKRSLSNQTTLRSGPLGERDHEIWDLPQNIDRCLRNLLEVAADPTKDLLPELQQREITFSATVNQSLLREHLIQGTTPHLVEAIDLSTPSGWQEFQGKPEGTRQQNNRVQGIHWTEAATASILVASAQVQLRNPLLELTTIADTPGTGSGNNAHDRITGHYLKEAEGFILLLSTDMADHQGVYQIMQRLHSQMKDRRRDDPASGLSSVAFVVNCFPTHGEKAQKAAIEKFKKLICDTFFHGQTAEWERLQSNERTRNFFVVRLKRVKEEGERLRKLYGYPSVIPLKDWVAALFRKGEYKARFNLFRIQLDDKWEEEYKDLKKQQEILHRDERDQAKRIKAIQLFLKDDLTSLAQPHLQAISSFRSEFTNRCAEVTTFMKSYSRDPIKLKPNDLERWQRRVQAYYTEVNERLRRFMELQTAQGWTEEVQAKLRFLSVTSPSLSPPDPTDQTSPWHEREHFETYSMNVRFERMIQNWPQSFFARAGEWLKRNFTSEEDTRIKLVRNIIEFWYDEYEALWNNRLETYLQRCEWYITQGNKQVLRSCQEAIREARNPADRALKMQRVKTGIARFDSFKHARDLLVRDLERELKRVN